MAAVMGRIRDIATHQEANVTIVALAEYLGVSTKTIYRHIAKGALSAIHVGPYRRVVRIPIREARAYCGVKET